MKIIAHRGAHGNLPENSQLSFDAALMAGMTTLEFDVNLTKDRVPVIIHDDLLLRTHSINQKISSLSHMQLQKLCYNNPVMSLPELLKRYAGQIELNIEIKSTGAGVVIGRVINNMSGINKTKLLVSSFKRRELSKFHTVCPDVIVSQLYKKLPEKALFFYMQPRLRVVSFANDRLPHHRVINFLKKRGLKIYSYTINDSNRALELENIGIDGIFCDDGPRMIRELEVLKKTD